MIALKWRNSFGLLAPDGRRFVVLDVFVIILYLRQVPPSEQEITLCVFNRHLVDLTSSSVPSAVLLLLGFKCSMLRLDMQVEDAFLRGIPLSPFPENGPCAR